MIHFFWEAEYDVGLEILCESNARLAYMMSDKMKNHNWYLFDISKIYLPDVFLRKNDLASPPKRLDFDIINEADIRMESAMDLEKSIKEIGVRRPHLFPIIYSQMLEDVENGVIGVRYFPNSNNGFY